MIPSCPDCLVVQTEANSEDLRCAKCVGKLYQKSVRLETVVLNLKKGLESAAKLVDDALFGTGE